MNRFLTIIKWPLALGFLWILPAAALTLWDFLLSREYSLQNVPPLAIGFAGYLILWLFLFRRQEVGSYLSTLEHESTHALFALLTGHRITRMRVTAFDGGEVVYKGPGNWLIIIAPYFFPTITVLLLLVRPFWPNNMWLEGSVGASVAFHLGSTWHETHGGQTDLKKAGWFFSFCFLPTANLLVYIMVGYYLLEGWNGLVTAAHHLWEHTVRYSVPVYHLLQEKISGKA